MTKFIVAVFPDEAKAEEGQRALTALHDQGDLTVYAAAVLVKGADDIVSVRRETSPGPLGVGLGALIGGLVGLLGGPVVSAFGAAAGAVSGGWLDVMRLGVRGEFLQEVSGKLTSGKECGDRRGIRISKALFRAEEEYEMDLWVVKYASRRSRIGDFSGDSSVRGARIRGVLASHASAGQRGLSAQGVEPDGRGFTAGIRPFGVGRMTARAIGAVPGY
jgi:hypothetical protein